MISHDEWRAALDERFGRDLRTSMEAARVAVCGLGGLGSNISIALARSGVGTLHLIDFDRVDISNLNRQQYEIAQLGMEKTTALRETLARIAPFCTVVTETLCIREQDIPTLFEHIREGRLDPSFLLTHRLPLERGALGYRLFKNKKDRCVRAVFAPGDSVETGGAPGLTGSEGVTTT